MSPMLRRVAVGVLAGSALALGIWAGHRYATDRVAGPPALQSGTALPQPRALGPFSLGDTAGGAFDTAALQGRWTLLSFGYTSCPDVCPVVLGVLRDVQRRLDEGQPGMPLRVVFVSVDPERDGLDHLRQYVTYFDARFVGATGSHAALQDLTRQAGVLYQRAPGSDASPYLVDHSATILLVDPQGRLAALFSPPHDAAALARDVVSLADAARR